jgi:chromatin remodeling complex protein RSC6
MATKKTPAPAATASNTTPAVTTAKTASKTAAKDTAAAVAPAIDPAPTDVAPTSESGSDASRFEALIEKLQVVASASKDLITQVRLLQKDFAKLQKDKAKAEQLSVKIQNKKEKKASKASDPSVKRSPSGFAKPTKLSDELCTFLGVPSGTEMARTDVTRMLNTYIKKHGLQDPNDKRSIKPNADLQKILEPGDVTYFNLQAKIKRHFIKVEGAK